MDGTARLGLFLKKITSSPSWEFCPISFSVWRSHSASYRQYGTELSRFVTLLDGHLITYLPT